MKPMPRLLLLALGIALLKVVLNASKYVQCRRHLEKYRRYLANEDTAWPWIESKALVLRLLRGAGIEDAYRPNSELAGYMQVAAGTVSVLANLHLKRPDIVNTVLDMLHQALGVYRSRTLEAFSPIYWLELIVNLPRHVLSGLGASPDGMLASARRSRTGCWLPSPACCTQGTSWR